jgi:energy-coupling factor transport system ATP-binding protein
MLANGLLLPDDGTVLVDGVSTADADRLWELRSSVGLVLQDPDDQIVGTVVEEEVAFGPENLGLPRAELRARVDRALAAVGLTGLERREPHLLSGGQKQRLAIAGTLAMAPRYLVLDEPTAMLDPASRACVMDVVAGLACAGAGVLHVTHDLIEAAMSDRIIALERGVVAFDGTPGQLLAEAALIDRLGLSLPPVARMAGRLRTRGFRVPDEVLDATGLVDALCL